MQFFRMQRDRIFISLVGVLIISQLCLGLNDTNIRNFFYEDNSLNITAIENPRKYLVSEIAPLFSNWEKIKSSDIELKVNEIFKNLDIDIRLVKNTLQVNGDWFEFLVYIDKYKRSFLVRYTPLVDDLTQLIQKEEFRLEIKVSSAWMPIPLDRFFG